MAPVADRKWLAKLRGDISARVASSSTLMSCSRWSRSVLTAVADLVFVALLAGFFLAFGRASPAGDRPPLRSLTAAQLALAVLQGAVAFTRLHERRRGSRPAVPASRSAPPGRASPTSPPS